eukprot:3730353-Amphidinium_carterae.1
MPIMRSLQTDIADFEGLRDVSLHGICASWPELYNGAVASWSHRELAVEESELWPLDARTSPFNETSLDSVALVLRWPYAMYQPDQH